MNISPRTRLINLIFYICGALRPLLGPSGVCIYTINCPMYAREQLQQRSLLVAVFFITLRVLSCNPLTVFFRYLRSKIITRY